MHQSGRDTDCRAAGDPDGGNMQSLQMRQPTKMMNVTIQQRSVLDHDEIACLAWHIWQQEGCVPGRNQDNWSKSEQLLLTANHLGSDRSTTEFFKYHLAKPRKDVRQSYETTFKTPWHHGGINE